MEVNMNNEPTFFKEIQRFRMIIMWLFIIPIGCYFLYGVVRQVIFNIPFGNRPASDLNLIIFFVVFGIIMPLLLYFANLTTEVRKDGLYFKFTPFRVRYHKILFRDIKTYDIRKYSPLVYGGWGIRYGIEGKAYNVFGNIGIQFELNNGRKILIGTQESGEFKDAIDKAIENKNR
jgi:hypothetical protein